MGYDGRPLRVVLAAESFAPDVNGVANSVRRVAEHLDQLGHEVVVIAPGPGAGHLVLAGGRRITVERTRSIALPLYPSLRVGVAAANRLRRLLVEVAPDVVHLAAPVVLGARVGQAAANLGLPTVALFQTDLSGFATEYHLEAAVPGIWSWLRSVHNRADLTLAPTRVVAAELRHQGFERVAVWGRGVDHAQFNPMRRSRAWRAAWGVGPGQVAVGYVGRLAAEKRVDRLAFLHGRPGIRLVVVGEGPERGRLERLLPEAAFTGLLTGTALGSAMASLDVVVHTGAHETFCQVIQEAMAARVAVVAPAAGGPLELVSDGRTGLLYHPGHPAGLVRAVETLVADPVARHRLAAAGHASVAGRTWAAVNQQLLGHYRSVQTARIVAA